MSKVLEAAFENVKKSAFRFIDATNFEVQDAFIFWTNFSGKPNQFGNTAKTFNLAIPAEAASELLKLGYRVREEIIGELHNDDGTVVPAKVYFINVKVNMLSEYPPVVKVYSEYKGKRSQNVLDDETIGELDAADIKTCDLQVHCYPSKKYPGKCTGYLRTLYVIKEPDVVFGGKYDDWDETNVNDADQADLLGTLADDNPY